MNRSCSDFFINGASNLSMVKDSQTYCSLAKDDEAFAKIDCGSDFVNISIDHSLTQPLVINNQIHSSIKIEVKPRAHAYILMCELPSEGSLEIKLQDKANATVMLLPTEAKAIVSKIFATVDASAHLRLFELGFQSLQYEQDMLVELMDKEARFSYFGLDQLYGNQQKRSSLVIKHCARETKSSQTFRGIYSGESSGTFLGQVIVEKSAEKSAASQLYKSTILSKSAKAEVMPELLIHNHDTSASHGASIGELDAHAVFYLRSRGIKLLDAKALLLSGFVDEVLNHIDVPKIRQVVSEQSAQRTACLLGDAS